MDLRELQVTIAQALNKAVDIPIVSEEYEQLFFEKMLEAIWNQLPTTITGAIAKISGPINNEVLQPISDKLMRIISNYVSQILRWHPKQNEIATRIHGTIIGLCQTQA